jgi:hypothetical protein
LPLRQIKVTWTASTAGLGCGVLASFRVVAEAAPTFVEKFKMLHAVSESEFHIYRVSDLVLPHQSLG